MKKETLTVYTYVHVNIDTLEEYRISMRGSLVKSVFQERNKKFKKKNVLTASLWNLSGCKKE